LYILLGLGRAVVTLLLYASVFSLFRSDYGIIGCTRIVYFLRQFYGFDIMQVACTNAMMTLMMTVVCVGDW